MLGKRPPFYTNCTFTTKKYEFHQENQKNYALDPDQELPQMLLKMLHFKTNCSLKKRENIILFLVTVKIKILCCFLQLCQKGNSLSL